MKRTSLGLNKFDPQDTYSETDVTNSLNKMNTLYGKLGVLQPLASNPNQPIISGAENVFSDPGDWMNWSNVAFKAAGRKIAIYAAGTLKKAMTLKDDGSISGFPTVAILKPQFWPMNTVGTMSTASGPWVAGWISAGGPIRLNVYGGENTTLAVGQSLALRSEWFVPAALMDQVAGIRIPLGSESFNGAAMNEMATTVDGYAKRLKKLPSSGKRVDLNPSGSTTDTYGVLVNHGSDDWNVKFRTDVQSYITAYRDKIYVYVAGSMVKGSAPARTITTSGDIVNLDLLTMNSAVMTALGYGSEASALEGGYLSYSFLIGSNQIVMYCTLGVTGSLSAVSASINRTGAASYPYTWPSTYNFTLDGWIDIG